MDNYLSIANGSIFYLAAAAVVLFVLVQSFLFLRLAFREGARLGLSRKKMFRALRTGALSSVVPSVAIVVALAAMVPVLGVPIPWMRLSVIGSAPYELMAAGIGAKVTGVDSLGGEGYTAATFATSVWIMCVGSIWAVSIVALFLRRIKTRYSRSMDKDPVWKSVLIQSAFLGVFSIFIAGPITTGGLPLATLLSGGAIMTVLAVLIVKLRVNWLREFALTFSMLGAMGCSILFAQWLG